MVALCAAGGIALLPASEVGGGHNRCSFHLEI